jgi:putative ABC transport system substrate-binding protein
MATVVQAMVVSTSRHGIFRNLLAISSALVFALAVPQVVVAEPAANVRIGILNTTHAMPARTGVKNLVVAEMQRLGYSAGRNLTVDSRDAGDETARLSEMARELLQLNPDVIITTGTMESTVAAMKATATVPIVFLHAVDPVRTGLVSSLARPGGNVTGVTSLNADLGAKRLEIITEILPNARRVAVLVSPADLGTASMVEALASAARRRRVQLDIIEMRDQANLAAAVVESKKVGDSALLVLGSPPLYLLTSSLADLTSRHHLPAVSAWREFAEMGGLASYGTGLGEMSRRAAGMVDRILKGAKPAELPVEQPTKFELVINMKAAKQLGIVIPESVLLRADEVIR